MRAESIDNATLLLGDCLERMAEIPDGSVDMVLCDLPYGITHNKWDAIIPLEPLWAHYWRVCKPNAAIVLTASQPFTSALVMSQVKAFKYQWIWEKSKATGFLNAKKQPLRAHEDVLIFYQAQPTYNPQMGIGQPYLKKGGPNNSENYKPGLYCRAKENDGQRYPRTVVQFSSVSHGDHPTQKPVALMEYLIRTYTNPGETVMDNCFGSGTTGVACVNTRRKFIGIERDERYFDIAVRRIKEASMQSQLFAPSATEQEKLMVA